MASMSRGNRNQFPFNPNQPPFGGLVPTVPGTALVSPVVVKFFAEVNPNSTQQLMQALDLCVRQGVSEINLLISTSGGSVHHGVSLYNYIRGIPAKVTTHNFGAVDSIGLVLFASGSRRLSVPQARFMIHRVAAGIGGPAQMGEDQLVQLLKSLQADEKNIARIIAENSNRTVDQVLASMKEQATLFPDELQKWGLVHDIANVSISTEASLLTIQ